MRRETEIARASQHLSAPPAAAWRWLPLAVLNALASLSPCPIAPQSPPRAAGSQGSGTADLAQLYAAAQPGGAPPTSAGAGGSATPPDPLPPAASSGQLQPVDTLLIRRLASDVAHSSDVVAAWEEVESLRQALRLKDAELASALEALAAAQAFGESPGAVQRHSETAGQQLARFLKDQLAMRDGQLAAAQAEAAELRAALADSEERRAQLEAALSEAQADAGYARLEAEEARQDAAAQLAAMRSELWAAEARANLAAYGTPEGEELGVASCSAVCFGGGGSLCQTAEGSVLCDLSCTVCSVPAGLASLTHLDDAAARHANAFPSAPMSLQAAAGRWLRSSSRAVSACSSRAPHTTAPATRPAQTGRVTMAMSSPLPCSLPASGRAAPPPAPASPSPSSSSCSSSQPAAPSSLCQLLVAAAPLQQGRQPQTTMPPHLVASLR